MWFVPSFAEILSRTGPGLTLTPMVQRTTPPSLPGGCCRSNSQSCITLVCCGAHEAIKRCTAEMLTLISFDMSEVWQNQFCSAAYKDRKNTSSRSWAPHERERVVPFPPCCSSCHWDSTGFSLLPICAITRALWLLPSRWTWPHRRRQPNLAEREERLQSVITCWLRHRWPRHQRDAPVTGIRESRRRRWHLSAWLRSTSEELKHWSPARS